MIYKLAKKLSTLQSNFVFSVLSYICVGFTFMNFIAPHMGGGNKVAIIDKVKIPVYKPTPIVVAVHDTIHDTVKVSKIKWMKRDTCLMVARKPVTDSIIIEQAYIGFNNLIFFKLKNINDNVDLKNASISVIKADKNPKEGRDYNINAVPMKR